MTIQYVLQIALGRPPGLNASHPVYKDTMEMLEREWRRLELVRSGQLSGEYRGWFTDHPEAAPMYEAWLKDKPVEPVWTLQNHLDAINDHYRAARALVK